MMSAWLLIVLAAVAVSGPLVYSRSFAPAECKTVWIPDCGKGELRRCVHGRFSGRMSV